MLSENVHLCIGVRVQSDVRQLHATLASLRANSGRAFRLVLLPDGPDEEMIGALRGMREPQLPTPQERGAGDCLARLVAAAATPIVAFLESGAVVGPGWLDRLLAALERAIRRRRWLGRRRVAGRRRWTPTAARRRRRWHEWRGRSAGGSATASEVSPALISNVQDRGRARPGTPEQIEVEVRLGPR